jgi:hypothetical protein
MSTDYAWCFDNPKEAAAEICRLEREVETLKGLLRRWLKTSERWSFLANDTRNALNYSTKHCHPPCPVHICSQMTKAGMCLGDNSGVQS